jgi:hypothetical protein
MKLALLLTLFLSLSVKAKLPANLPNFSNINSIVFRVLKDHMFQVFSKSKLYEFDNNCRVYKFSDISGTNSARELIFCLTNTLEEKRIIQDLRVQVDHQFAGNFKLIHEGEKASALSFDEFINFQIRPPAKGAKMSFFFDLTTFGLIIDRRFNQETLTAYTQLEDFKIDISEDGALNHRYRNYLLSCSDCQGLSWLKVQEDDSRLRYFSGSVATEVTPAHFNQFINFFIIRPFSQIGSQLKDKLVLELNWPNLN